MAAQINWLGANRVQLYPISSFTKEKSMHDAIYELRNDKLTDNERYAMRRGLIKADGILTDNGRQVFVQWLFNAQGDQFLSELQHIAEGETARKDAIDNREALVSAPVASQE
jgi:DNA-binding PadR family transcriptional regulator